MKKQLSVNDVKVKDVTRSSSAYKAGLIGIGLMATISFSCSDDKVCTDSDTSRYDTGTYADPTDFGGQGDPGGSGDRCSDSD